MYFRVPIFLAMLASLWASTAIGKAETTSPIPRDPASYTNAALKRHNFHRRAHGSPDLVWDHQLTGRAILQANTCKFAHDMGLGGGGYGQNIYMVGGTNASPGDNQDPLIVSAIDSWYSEIADYGPYYGLASPPLHGPKEVLHFTQLVWKGSLTVGCASHFCPAGSPMGKLNSWFVVCNYGPAGNVMGAFAKNVSPPSRT